MCIENGTCAGARGSTASTTPDKEGVYVARMRGTSVWQKIHCVSSYSVLEYFLSSGEVLADPIAIRPKLSVNVV